MGEVAICSDASQVKFTFRMNVQATLAKLAIRERFAGRRGMHKLTRVTPCTIREELAAFQDFSDSTA